MNAKPFDLWAKMPPVMQQLLPNVLWDRTRLHKLALPVGELPLDELRWQLALPWWRDGDRRFVVTPNQVRAEPARFEMHWRRTQDADLSFPIDLLQRDRLIVLDGVHRLLKADMVGMPTIAVRVLGPEDFSAIVEHA